MAEADDLRDLEVFARVFARGERIDSDAGRSRFQEIQERIGTRFNEDDMARLVTTLPPREDGVPHSGAEIQQAMQAQDAEVVRITGKLIAETPLTTEELRSMQQATGTALSEAQMREAAQNVTTSGDISVAGDIRTAVQTAQDAEVVRITGKLIAETPLTTEELRSMQQATGTALSEAQMREAAQNVTTSGDISVAGDIRTAVQAQQGSYVANLAERAHNGTLTAENITESERHFLEQSTRNVPPAQMIDALARAQTNAIETNAYGASATLEQVRTEVNAEAARLSGAAPASPGSRDFVGPPAPHTVVRPDVATEQGPVNPYDITARSHDVRIAVRDGDGHAAAKTILAFNDKPGLSERTRQINAAAAQWLEGASREQVAEVNEEARTQLLRRGYTGNDQNMATMIASIAADRQNPSLRAVAHIPPAMNAGGPAMAGGALGEQVQQMRQMMGMMCAGQSVMCRIEAQRTNNHMLLQMANNFQVAAQSFGVGTGAGPSVGGGRGA